MNIWFKTILTFGILLQAIVFGITPNQTDNFQDGTTQGWVSGPLNPNQPSVFPCGFGGGNDLFLRVISNYGLSSGVNFYQIKAGSYATTKKFILLK